MSNLKFSDFAKEWVDAWNAHDLDAIMSHYAEDLEFRSPVIQQMKINDAGLITRKEDLRTYFEKALWRFPDLHFELYHVLEGVRSIVLFYKSINNRYSAEYMELNDRGEVVKVNAHYTHDN